MKLLLTTILLVLSINCYSQVDTSFTKSFLKLYKQYEVECYNDSTIISYLIPIVVGSDGKGRFGSNYEAQYAHLNHPTFQGFIEYLKKIEMENKK